jgi:hypothetical protein
MNNAWKQEEQESIWTVAFKIAQGANHTALMMQEDIKKIMMEQREEF